ncbi:MAG: hypothetical protein V2I51_08125 [Anderseniella sp.]|jgi:hypothetical protein|nr:hypothetical protein [Anderseniella sp.]
MMHWIIQVQVLDMGNPREKFATQVDARLLAELRELARQEGRQLQALVDEAIEGLIEQRRTGKARAHVMSAYKKSHERFAPLYRKLAQ